MLYKALLYFTLCFMLSASICISAQPVVISLYICLAVEFFVSLYFNKNKFLSLLLLKCSWLMNTMTRITVKNQSNKILVTSARLPTPSFLLSTPYFSLGKHTRDLAQKSTWAALRTSFPQKWPEHKLTQDCTPSGVETTLHVRTHWTSCYFHLKWRTRNRWLENKLVTAK